MNSASRSNRLQDHLPGVSVGASFDTLSPVFLALGFLNFAIGAALGGVMTIDDGLTSILRPMHAALNPFGWLTMLIYGMTYATLSHSLKLRPRWPWLGAIHLALAEAGVLMAVIAVFAGPIVATLGVSLIAAAPVAFLIHILSSVKAARRARTGGAIAGEESTGVSPASERLFGSNPAAVLTDRIAQRGTDAALMIFVAAMIATVWGDMTGRSDPSNWLPGLASILAYYGWIGGTVIAVALHLYPRLSGKPVALPRMAAVAQLLWGVGVLMTGLGSLASPWIEMAGSRLMGISFLAYAVIFLWPTRGAFQGIPRITVLAWRAAWAFALLLGASLALGLDPLTLAALHLLFLGWITTLVYGIGYTFFPLILHRVPVYGAFARVQLSASLIGAAALSAAFYLRDHVTAPWVPALLGLGGALAALGALGFLLQWPFAKRTIAKI